MSISVNYILEEYKRKKKQAQTAPVATPDETFSQGGGIVPPGAIERRTAQQINMLNKKRKELSQPDPVEQDGFDYSGKPEGWGDDEYRAVRQIYSDEQIQQALSQPNPENFLEGIYTQMYKKNVPEPKEPDEKQLKRQRAIAGIGDVLGLISQAAGGSQGAINRPRTFEQSAYGQLTKKQQEVYDRYQAETDRYGRELVNAQMKDYLAGLQDWKQTQANIAKTLDAYRDYQLEQAKQQQEAAYKAAQEQRQQQKTAADIKNIESQIKDRERRANIAEQTAALAAERTKAYIEKLKTPVKTTTGNKADYQLVIPADANDPNAVRDQFGNPVRVFGMSTGEMDQYARKALADKDFINRHPEYRLLFGQKYTADDKRNIAATYLEELYNNSQVDATTGAGERFSGQIPEIEAFIPELDEEELDEMFKVIY